MDPHDTPEHAAAPVTATVVDPRYAAPPRRRTRILGPLLVVVLLVVLAGSIVFNVLLLGALGFRGMDTDARKVREKFFSHERYATNKVVVISVEGPILDSEGFVKRQIDRAAKDDDVKAVVVRVNSPGGTITGSDYIYHHLCRLAKGSEIPLVVSMGGIAASGGYYVAMAVGDTPECVFAEPATWTGSIGVVIPHYNLSELLTKWGIKEDSIASHPLKTMGSFAKPMTSQEREIFQTLVDQSFDRFKDIVREGRPKFAEDPEALDKLATGQIYTARQALQNGLVDKIGFIEDAIDRAIELARLDPSDVRVIQYKPEPTVADILFGNAPHSRNVDLVKLLDFSTPRAYYLCTWLPTAARSGEGR